MNTYITNFSEAQDEAERLKRVTGAPHTVVREDCNCDYDRMCGKCAGEGQYYDVVEQTVVKAEGAPLRSCADLQLEQEEAEWEATQV